MPWTREEKYLCLTTYLVTKSFKTVQVKFRTKFNCNNHPQKSQIYRWTHKFQVTGSLNNLNKKAENPRSGRKFTTKCPENVDAVRDSVGPQKSQIYGWTHKFQVTGSLNNLNKKAENPRSGRKFTTKCPENVDAVRDSVGSQKSQIYRWTHKFQVTGSLNNLNKKAENPRSGRKFTAKCPENVDAVRDSVGKSPKKSLRRHSQKLGLSRALWDRVNQFLPLSSGLTFLKWYDWFLCLFACLSFIAYQPL